MGVATQQPAGAYTDPSQAGGGQALSGQSNTYSMDATIPHKIAGAVIIALIVIFASQAMGFRFVTSANISLGR